MASSYRTLFEEKSLTQRGFTIVELLIVIVIIAILAAITIVGYNGINNRAKDSAAQQSVSQAYKKVLAYAVDNADTYPVSTGTNGIDGLTAIGLNNDGATTYQYTANNTTTPKTFCMTATNSNRSFYSSSTSPTPKSGGCAGHGSGGIAAVTNIFTNPNALSGSGFNTYEGNGGTRAASIASVPWSTAGKAYRVTWSVAPTNANDGDIGVTVANFITAGTTYTLVYKVNVSRTADVTAPGIYSGTGSYQRLAASTTAITTVTAGEPQQRWITFKGDQTAINNTLRVVQSMRSKVNNDWIEISDVLIVEGSNVYKFANGDSENWVWNGTVGTSTSTGPPTAL